MTLKNSLTLCGAYFLLVFSQNSLGQMSSQMDRLQQQYQQQHQIRQQERYYNQLQQYNKQQDRIKRENELMREQPQQAHPMPQKQQEK